MARPAPIDIDAARERVRGLVRRTPVLRLDAPAFGVATPIVIKLEQLQHTGSFKTRGAFNQILAAGTPGRVVAASGGNFGLAVAYAAKTLGIHAEIFLPEVVDPAKARRLQLLGAETVIVPGFYADA